jgi:hypothetical protein
MPFNTFFLTFSLSFVVKGFFSNKKLKKKIQKRKQRRPTTGITVTPEIASARMTSSHRGTLLLRDRLYRREHLQIVTNTHQSSTNLPPHTSTTAHTRSELVAAAFVREESFPFFYFCFFIIIIIIIFYFWV